jgi:excisionase family DNA binding protein
MATTETKIGTIRETAANPFLSVVDSAKTISVSEATIRRLLWQRKLKRYKVGNRTLIKFSDLMGLVKEAK